MSPVFGHGRLRLYLLKLLEESPRHGYEVIRLLQDRFLGVYSPSPGTIYPRLARLEEEGLVTHEVKDGKKVFTITDKGRAELNDRLDELAELEQEIADSVRDIAREVKEDVRETVRSLRDELTQMAREMRRADPTRQAWQEQKQEWRRIWDRTWASWGGYGASGRPDESRSKHDAELGRMLADFVEEIRREAAEVELSEATLTYCREALDDVSARIREALRS